MQLSVCKHLVRERVIQQELYIFYSFNLTSMKIQRSQIILMFLSSVYSIIIHSIKNCLK